MVLSRSWFVIVPFLLAALASSAGGSDLKSRGRFYRENVNNLDALLKAVSVGPFIAISVFTLEYRELAANWYHSITHFGRVDSVLLLAFDDTSLLECLQLGFPCFNASILVAKHSIPTGMTYGTAEYNRLMWSKPLILAEVLKRQRSALFSDLDTVWFKDAFRSYLYAADVNDADFVGMNDDNHGYPNAGNLFFRSNPRTVAFVDAWLAIGLNLKTRQFTPNASQFHDQEGLKLLNNSHWRACSDAAGCAAVKATGRAAVWLHPWHGCPNPGFQPCERNLLYVHLFCTGGGVKHKVQMASEMQVWFVGADVNEPHMVGASAVDLINATHVRRHTGHHYGQGSGEQDERTRLPCPNEVAFL